MEKRQSNFELMRIISMFMIIGWHIFLYGAKMDNATPHIKLFFDFFRSIMVVHVNSFILISGYFLINSNFKMSKLLKLNNATLFYKILFYLIFIFLGVASIDSVSIIRNFFPFDLENYWFIRIYLLMYIFSPFYNIFLNNISKKTHKTVLLIMFFLFSILSTITKQQAVMDYTVSYGCSIISFTFLYFIGAYFRKYPIEKTYFWEKCSKNLRQFIFIVLFFLLALFNYCIHITSIQFLNYDGFLRYIGDIIFLSFNQYDNPIVVMQSICYFMIFYHMSFSNKLINVVSSTTIGIYLIHDNLYIRNSIYSLFNFAKHPASKKIFIDIFVATTIIFIVCFVIEFIRQKLFKLIYNFKISKWWREKYRGYLKSLGLNIKW